MSQINISQIAAAEVATPEAGKHVIFSDSSNNGHLSTKDSQGRVVDLTLTGGGTDLDSMQLVRGGAGTSIEIFEKAVTLTTGELLTLSTKGGLNPSGGMMILPAPGEGKINVMLLGATATWKPGTGAALVAEPYQQHRTIDFYYQVPGYNGNLDSEVALSIPLTREPFSSYAGDMRQTVPRPIEGTNDEEFVQPVLYNKEEPLNIDRTYENQVWKRLPEGSGISSISAENAELWISINDKLVSAPNPEGLEASGEIIIKFYYGIVSLKEGKTQRVPQVTLPERGDNWKQHSLQLPRHMSGMFNTNMDFADIEWNIPKFHEFEWQPGWRALTEGFSYEDLSSNYRGQRDAFLKSSNEFALAAAINSDAWRWSISREQIAGYPLPLFYGRGPIEYPWLGGASPTLVNWPSSCEYSLYLERPFREERDTANGTLLGYKKTAGTVEFERRLHPAGETAIWNSQSGRVVGFNITTPGKGYSAGETVYVNPMDLNGDNETDKCNWTDFIYEDVSKRGTLALGRIKAVDSEGGILDIEVLDNDQTGSDAWYSGETGGYRYDETTTASAGPGMPLDPTEADQVAKLLADLHKISTELKTQQQQLLSTNRLISTRQISLEWELPMYPLDNATIKNLQSQINDLTAQVPEIETLIVELRATKYEIAAQLAQLLSGVTAIIEPVIQYEGAWILESDYYELYDISGYPGLKGVVFEDKSGAVNSAGLRGRQKLENLETTKRATRDASMKALNEFALAQAPYVWSSLYLVGFQIDKYFKEEPIPPRLTDL